MIERPSRSFCLIHHYEKYSCARLNNFMTADKITRAHHGSQAPVKRESFKCSTEIEQCPIDLRVKTESPGSQQCSRSKREEGSYESV